MAKVSAILKGTFLLFTLFQAFEISFSQTTTKKPATASSVNVKLVDAHTKTNSVNVKSVDAPTKTNSVNLKKVDTPKANLVSVKAVDAPVDKYRECAEKCKKDGVHLECAYNGWWYLNKCHRECQGENISPYGEVACNPYEKMEFDSYWRCQVNCEGTPAVKDCGEDGTWYDNACKRECFGVSKADNKFCEDLDKGDECRMKCLADGYDPNCGVDGVYYDNSCHRECIGTKAGTEGKECPLRLNFGKLWSCQEKCQSEVQQPKCGKSGFWYSNQCHIDCYGDTIGEMGKDCPNPEEGY